IEYWAKKSGPMRFFVDSSDTALAPFSQNSKIFRCLSGLGHAQLWQANPVTWLIFRNASGDRNTPISLESPRLLPMPIPLLHRPALVDSAPAARSVHLDQASGPCPPRSQPSRA